MIIYAVEVEGFDTLDDYYASSGEAQKHADFLKVANIYAKVIEIKVKKKFKP